MCEIYSALAFIGLALALTSGTTLARLTTFRAAVIVLRHLNASIKHFETDLDEMKVAVCSRCWELSKGYLIVASSL